ncbi:hypothetical protein Pcinc_042550 [Petrolisthes cinctipes]|uniref:Uncharacterized protein n=1 Tax=Petrolisthes cinctipes TaxID=88211 RepID=A0AAE1BKE0_PETCI|nr:hypothetical protein Pcinc_042550 [Petrolisthes cinctipes]
MHWRVGGETFPVGGTGRAVGTHVGTKPAHLRSRSALSRVTKYGYEEALLSDVVVDTHCLALTTRAPQTSPLTQSFVPLNLSPPPNCPSKQNDNLKSQQRPLRTEGLNNLRLIDFQRLSTKRGDVTGMTSLLYSGADWLARELAGSHS